MEILINFGREYQIKQNKTKQDINNNKIKKFYKNNPNHWWLGDESSDPCQGGSSVCCNALY